MKRVIVAIIFLILFPVSVLTAEPGLKADDNRQIKEEMLTALNTASEKNDLKKCQEIIASLYEYIAKTMTPESEMGDALCMNRACSYLESHNYSSNPSGERFHQVAVIYADKFLRMNLHGIGDIECQWSTLNHVLYKEMMIMGNDVKKKVDFCARRKWQAEKLIQLWNQFENKADRQWKLRDHAEELRPVLQDFFDIGFQDMPSISIKNEEERKEYLKRKKELYNKKKEQYRATQLQDGIRPQDGHRKEIVEVLTSYYMFPPHDVQELEELLKILKGPDEMVSEIKEKILEPIKKQATWVTAGNREWVTTDGLFKTTAKFVTLTKGDVTLEKPDGKRTTIELKALRKIDQDYVNEQIDREKPNRE